MASWIELLQNIASVTRHVQDLQAEQRAFRSEIETRVRSVESAQAQATGQNLAGRVTALEQAAAGVSQAISRLEEARATTRAEVRAEITAAVAELRVRYAEERSHRDPGPPMLPGGDDDYR